jgi:hypothetical protein
VLPKHDDERDAWMNLSGTRLTDAYDSDEIEYPIDLVKEINPEYEGRWRDPHTTIQKFAKNTQ